MLETAGSRAGRGSNAHFRQITIYPHDFTFDFSNLYANSSYLSLGNTSVNVVLNTSTIAIGLNVVLNTSALFIGNSTVNLFANSSTMSIINTSGSFANLFVRAGTIAIGNSTQNTFVNSTGFFINGVSIATPPAGINTQVQYNNSGAFGANAGFTFTSTTNTVAIANAVVLGSNAFVNTTTFGVGNSTINTSANSSGFFVNAVSINKQVNAQIFTSNGTFTVPNGVTQLKVTVVGGGGGGGGAKSYSTTVGCPGVPVTEPGVGGGGAGGGVGIKWITTTPGSTFTVTVGLGGTAGTAVGGAGGTGGTTSFGTSVTATGGSGGTGANSINLSPGSAGNTGGLGSSGNYNLQGDIGGEWPAIFTVPGGSAFDSTSFSNCAGGKAAGGFSPKSLYPGWLTISPATSQFAGSNAGTVNAIGNNGISYGGGASGGVSNNTTTGVAGGTGATGLCIVEWVVGV